MPARCQISQADHTLIIRVQQRSSYLESLIYGAIAGIAIAGLGAPFLRIGWLSATSVVASIFAFRTRYKMKRIELRINDLEFQRRGRFEGAGYPPTRTVSTQDVRWLEHREELAGNDTYDPPGLYAVLAKGILCILPYLDGAQSANIVGAISAKFPSMAERWRMESPFNQHFLTMAATPQKIKTEP
jgi:hypothetical protein